VSGRNPPRSTVRRARCVQRRQQCWYPVGMASGASPLEVARAHGLKAVFRVLGGIPSAAARRATTLLWLSLGERRTVRTSLGRLRECGEYALHRQTPWRFLGPLVLGAGLLVGCRSVPYVEPEEWDRELPVGVHLEPWNEDDVFWIPMRVVDDVTGEPIAGARIDNLWEANWPGGEPWEECIAQSRITDRDGVVLMRRGGEHGNWIYVEAPGYAPLGEMSWEREWRLVRGKDVPVEVRDWLDRPVAGATVEYFLGCGHTPNVRVEVTDERGRAVLRGIDHKRGFLWIRGDGLLGRTDGYDGLDLPQEDGVRIVRCWPAPVVEGSVLHADGTPAAGALVGTRDRHRGPWTVARSDGRFRLVGAPPYDALTVDAPPPPGSPAGTPRLQRKFQTVPGITPTVRLSRLGAKEDADLVLLMVSVRAEGDVVPSGAIRVVAVQDAGGRAEVAEPEFQAKDGQGGVAAIARFRVEPGIWQVTAGTPGGMLVPSIKKRVRVGEEGAEIFLGLVENPLCRPVVLERCADSSLRPLKDVESGRFHIVTSDGREDAVPSSSADGAIHVPIKGPFAVEYTASDRRSAKVVVWDGLTDRARALVLRSPNEEREDPVVELPYEGDFPKARLTVSYPDGTPARHAAVVISGSVAPNLHYSQLEYLDENGSLEFAFRRHDRVEVRARDLEESSADPSLPSLVAFIDGPGPWTLHWPDTELTVRAVNAGGVPVDSFTVHLPHDDEVWTNDGTLVLRGAPTGPVRFWVEAEGMRTRDVRLLVTAGEKRAWTVTLNPEAPP